ncbi:hypothetical protein BREU_1404 [Bifidobacterium reuteri DSM 23975]|uniref:Uncharacterized protein n=1 Tax=Bifidobacterium reuteri DSM 23975 TaxID=1437610 RepID=A0A087CSI1_9BIFI|nr:hypothetical protein BREU_1404 [Bifidobacterium reuteri DSM 23975]
MRRRNPFAFIRDWLEAMLILLVFELANLLHDRKPRRRR